jgi:hypothetical protein
VRSEPKSQLPQERKPPQTERPFGKDTIVGNRGLRAGNYAGYATRFWVRDTTFSCGVTESGEPAVHHRIYSAAGAGSDLDILQCDIGGAADGHAITGLGSFSESCSLSGTAFPLLFGGVVLAETFHRFVNWLSIFGSSIMGGLAQNFSSS